MMDQNHIKADFPIFSHYPDLIFADNASTTHKPEKVISAVSEYYQKHNANIHRAVYDLGIMSDQIYSSTKKLVLEYYNLDDKKFNVIYTAGTTDGINKIAYSLEHLIEKGDNIIVSEMEHHSNLLPWQELCKRKEAELRLIPLDTSGDLDFQVFQSMLDQKTKIVSLVHISNTLGTVNDLNQVKTILNGHPALFLVDSAQSCGLYADEFDAIGADAFVFGAHKMFGPSGIGLILATNRLVSVMRPFQYGGGMVKEVEKQFSTYRENLSIFEAGTPPLAQIAGLNACLKYLMTQDLRKRRHCIAALVSRLRLFLNEEGIKYQGRPARHSSVISVDFEEIHPHDAATFLNSENIAVRAGHHCTQLIMKHFNLHSSIRFSFSIYNTEEEVDDIIRAIYKMKKYFG